MGDKPFGFELAQGFAHRRAAHPQLTGQGVAAQPLTWREGAVHDGLPKRPVHRLRCRCVIALLFEKRA